MGEAPPRQWIRIGQVVGRAMFVGRLGLTLERLGQIPVHATGWTRGTAARSSGVCAW